MIDKNLEIIARDLRRAAVTKTPCAPVRDRIGVGNIAAAYAVQKVNNELRLSAGKRLIGRKIGLTSKAVQQQLGVDQPDYGLLFHDMEVLQGDTVPWGELMQAKVEAEIAFGLAKDLDEANLSIVDLIGAIDYALIAIEIVGSRIENWDIRITDTIADNASASHFVLSHRPVRLDNFDVVQAAMQLEKNGKIVSEGKGGACLGSPLNATLWLAKTMAELEEPLQAGEIILSGALGPMAAVEKGDVFVARVEGLGEVSVGF